MTTVSTPSSGPVPAPTEPGQPCPACGYAVVSLQGAAPWCPQCGWNLDAYEPDRRSRELRWKRLDRWAFRTAYAMNARQFADLSNRPIAKPGLTLARAALTGLSVVLLLLVLAFIGFGGWLVFGLGSLFPDVIGVIVIGVGVLLLPRFGRVDKYAEQVDPADVPQLNALIEQVASAVCAPRPHLVLFNSTFNAYSGAYGLRRRRVIGIGLPLWLSLTAGEQVALLGHELGHFVSGDVRRGPLRAFVFNLFGRLGAITRPDSGPSRYRHNTRQNFNGGSSAAVLGDLITRPIMWVLNSTFALCDVLVEWLGARASHHSEYAADGLAATAGGSVAATGMLDALVADDVCTTVLRRAIRAGSDSAQWRTEVVTARAQAAPQRDVRRQLTMRDDASLFRSHPPTGLRARLIESRTMIDAAVGQTPDQAAAIDKELASRYRTLRTDLTGGR